MKHVGILAMGGVLLWGGAMLGSVWNLTNKTVDRQYQVHTAWNSDWTLEPERVERIRYQQQQVDCLAQNVYHEARGEGEDGMIAVAAVTINRVNNRAWGRNVCDVVWEDSAFSWTLDKRLWKINEGAAYNRAQAAARKVYYQQVSDPTGGATHYHTMAVNPYWSKSGVQKMRIGAHVFMKMKSGGR
jgi:spore germination cell wall hydrolase CwlJ-like protein